MRSHLDAPGVCTVSRASSTLAPSALTSWRGFWGMKNLSVSELQTLNNANNETEWNAACDVIKGERDGQYPNDWFMIVLVGGVMHAFEKRSTGVH